MDILERWHDLIEATESLDVDGDGLLVQLSDPDEMKMALVAMVLYSSRIEARQYGWGVALQVDDDCLLINKVSMTTGVGDAQ